MKWLLLAVLLSGCAGHQAMIWRPMRAPAQPCGIKICEPGGVSGRIDPERDCRCSGKQSIEDIFR